MEKNVGSIDLEELKRAREELMQERGLTEEASASSAEPTYQEPSSASADADYGTEAQSGEQGSVLDNPNVSRVFERQESASAPKQEEEDDFDFDIDALVNEVFSDDYTDEIGEALDLSKDDETSLNDFIAGVESSEKEPAKAEQSAQTAILETAQPATASASVEPTASQPAPNSQQSAERDFSVYDSFAAFEVNDGAVQEQTTAPAVQETQEVPAETTDDSDVLAMIDDFNKENSAGGDTANLSAVADKLLFDENTSVVELSSQEEPVIPVETAEPQPEPEATANVQDDGFSALDSFEKYAVSSPVVEEEKVEPALTEQTESAEPSLASLGSFDFDKTEEPEPQTESIQVANEASADDFGEVTVENAETEIAEKTAEVEESANNAETEEQTFKGNPAGEETMSMVSSLSDLERMLKEDEERAAKLDEEIEKLEEQVKSGEILDDEETTEESAKEPAESSAYKAIEEYKFVDVIDLEEFKESDKLTYILGKDEQGVMHYGNLRDNYNLVVFGKENEHVNNFVHSVLLSLILKNTVNEVNFVICDSKADSKFEVYNKSSYMYFNRIAKTNKEILDILIELNKELEERYKLLADIGVKSIEQYNIIAKNDNLKPLPYIVTVFNNYSKAIQLTESDKINTCLYQMLKFGRIAGIYIVLAANNTIMSNEINYNLPTRISFKCEDSAMSLTTLGEDGAESLSKDGDFLCSTVGAEELVHLKVASLTSNEIELLIENIED